MKRLERAKTDDLHEALCRAIEERWPSARLYRLDLGVIMRHRHTSSVEYQCGGTAWTARAQNGAVDEMVEELLKHFGTVVNDPVAIGVYPTAICLLESHVLATAMFLERAVYNGSLRVSF